MSLSLTKENFTIFDVSGIKVEKRLAFEKNANNLVPRNEDEAFIKEFIRERDGARIGPKKIMLWGARSDWNQILWEIEVLHHLGWVKDEILKGHEDLPDIVEPDHEKDQVEGNESWFSGFYSLDRYIEKTVYDTDNQDGAWELPSMSAKEENLSGRIKKLDEFAAIYEDFSKMNGLWVSPIKGLNLSLSCDAVLGIIKDEDKDTQSIKSVNVSLEHSTGAVIEGGSLTLNNEAKINYTDPNGKEQTYTFSDNCIWEKIHNRVKIKNGRDDKGNLKYQEVDRKSEIKVDIEMDATGSMYETKEGEKLEWDLKAAIFMAEIDVTYHDYDTNKGSAARMQFIVKADVEGKKIIAGENIRKKLEGKIPMLVGTMTKMSVRLYTFAWLADIKWNMRIDDVKGDIIVANV